MPESDEELVVKVRAGDHQAFQLLVVRYARTISHFVGRIMPDAMEVEDIVQEVFIRLWHRSHRWQPARSGLSTWLHVLARNLCIDHFRKHRLYDVKEVEEFGDDDQMAEDLSGLSRSNQVKRCITGLPERQRTALILCHYQGFTNSEAAQILDTSVEALESLLSRARRRLKSLLLH